VKAEQIPNGHQEQPPLPVVLDAVDERLLAVVDQRPEFSGERVERDVQLVDAVLGAFAGGVSQRRIAAAFKLSRNTVAALIRRAEDAGRIEPYKGRLSGKLARAIEAGLEQWTDAVEAGQLSAGQIPVAVGIFQDKKLLLDGEATSRVEHQERVNVEDVMERLRRLREVQPVISIDSESVGSAIKSQ